MLLRLVLIVPVILLGGCATTPPSNLDNACEIFRQKSGWYDATQDAQDNWGVPAHVQLAIMHQESRFKHDAKPPREKLFWVIPWFRPSSAYGYAQAKDATWDWYISKTGNRGADRDDFDDAVDFIAWYGYMSYRLAGIPKTDAYRQYLAYHEGHGGYKKRSYNKKAWLVKVARKVDARSKRYRGQIAACADEFKGWSIWPF